MVACTPPTHASIFLSSELFSEFLPGKFNGCGIWTGKKRRWKFQRKWGFVLHEGSTSVFSGLGEGTAGSTSESLSNGLLGRPSSDRQAVII